MKVLRYILCSLLIAAAVGLLCYQYFFEKQLDLSDIVKAVLIICGAVLSLLRPQKRQVINKKALYEKAYSEFIQNAFYDEPKLEKRFYNAVHNYNQNKPAAGLAKLEKLRRECQRSNDLRAVTVFTALCLDDMQLYEQAIVQYNAALSMRDSSTLHSNKGLCLQHLGHWDDAQACYEQAIRSNPKNAYAYNNLSALYFRQDDYERALEFAVQAIEIDPKLPQALSTAAMCSALLGYTDDYAQYYRKAVANGYDGSKIKHRIKSLDPTI